MAPKEFCVNDVKTTHSFCKTDEYEKWLFWMILVLINIVNRKDSSSLNTYEINHYSNGTSEVVYLNWKQTKKPHKNIVF